VLAALVVAIFESTASATQMTVGSTERDASVHAETPMPVAEPMPSAQRLVVERKGAPVITFTGDAAVADEIAEAHGEIERIEHAMALDLGRGQFRAPATERVIGATRHAQSTSAPAELAAVRAELTALKRALRADLAHGAFNGWHTRREVARDPSPRSGDSEEALATDTIAITDEIWDFEHAVELDLHAHEFAARETHFAIDRRRW